jgi:hypothetical protein
MSALAPKPSVNSGFNAGYAALRLAGWLSILVNTNRPAFAGLVFLSPKGCRSMGYVYRATIVICN